MTILARNHLHLRGKCLYTQSYPGQVRRRRGRVMLLRHTAAAWLYEKNKTYPHADTVRIGFLQFALEEAQ